tara:strand:+ start:55 stop:279 length:225 start_codon:yes stop_codon:yes gene_type:complete
MENNNMKNKIYEKPTAFEIQQSVSGVRTYIVFAQSEAEAIEKVENNDLTVHDNEYCDELDEGDCTVIRRTDQKV